jgi:hypothetical protein
MNKNELKSGEAYKLMAYRAKDGDTIEILWNSRDGVTPFILHSQDGEEMNHVDWGRDIYAPFFVPAVGARIFVDLTMERAIEYRKQYVERYWEVDVCGITLRDQAQDYDGAVGKNDAELRELAVTRLAAADMESFAPHTPDVVVVTEEIQGQFVVRAREAKKSGEPQDPRDVYLRGVRGEALEDVR